MIDDLRNKPFSLALSGGGALGYAHLGILHDLDANNIRASEVLGTSMGGIIAACYAIGMSEKEITACFESFAPIAKWIKLSFRGKSLIDTVKIKKILERIFGNKTMMQTQIPLKIATTNLCNASGRIFGPGDNIYIVDVLLATIAVPGIFESHMIGDSLYADGFITNNLPISDANYDKVVASNVINKHRFVQKDEQYCKKPGMVDAVKRTYEMMIYSQTQKEIACSDKELLILEPDTSAFETYRFDRIEEIRRMGLGVIG